MFTDMLAARSISSFAGGLVAAQDGRCNKNRVNHPPKTPCKFQDCAFFIIFRQFLEFFPLCSFQCCNENWGKICPLHWKKIDSVDSQDCDSSHSTGRLLEYHCLRQGFGRRGIKKPQKGKNRRIMYYKRQGHPK